MVGNVYGAYWRRWWRRSGFRRGFLAWYQRGPTLFIQIAQPDVIGSINATRSGAVASFIRERLQSGGVLAARGE